jgi:hypothetical protein
LPYSIAVVNKGTVLIVAIAIRFKVIKGEMTIIRDYFYHAFRPTDAPVLAPGEARLFAPDNAANDMLHHRPSQPRSIAGLDCEAKFLGAADMIHVSIDLAVSRDRRIAGADEAKHVAQLLGQAQALHDIAADFVVRCRAGATDAELKTWLSSLSKNEDQSSDRYEATKRSIAAAWFGALASGKRADLEPSVAKIATLPDKTREFLTSLKDGLQ